MEGHDSTLDLCFNDSSINDGLDHALVGKLISSKVISYITINTIISSAWNLGQNILIKSVDKNMVMCTFKNKEDMLRYADNGP